MVKFSTLPVLRRAASDQHPSARPRPLLFPSAASSFLPSVKFPVTSMGFHVQHTCDRGTPGRHQGAGLGSVRALPTCFAVWKAPPGIKFMFLILVRWSGWEPRTHSWELREAITELIQRMCPEGAPCERGRRGRCWGTRQGRPLPSRGASCRGAVR